MFLAVATLHRGGPKNEPEVLRWCNFREPRIPYMITIIRLIESSGTWTRKFLWEKMTTVRHFNTSKKFKIAFSWNLWKTIRHHTQKIFIYKHFPAFQFITGLSHSSAYLGAYRHLAYWNRHLEFESNTAYLDSRPSAASARGQEHAMVHW